MKEFRRPTKEEYENNGRVDGVMPQHRVEGLPPILFVNPWLDGYARPWPRDTEMYETEEDDVCVPYVHIETVEEAIRHWAKQEGCNPADADDDVATVMEYLLRQRDSDD